MNEQPVSLRLTDIARRCLQCAPALLLALSTVASAELPPLESDLEQSYALAVGPPGMPVTLRQDRLDRPYLHVAGKEAGLLVYRLAQPEPVQVAALDSAGLGGLQPMSLNQQGKRLLLALGSHWDRGGVAGLAVVAIDDPERPRLVGLWRDEQIGAGGAVEARGEIAYLAAMGAGLLVIDLSDPAQPSLLARLRPALDFPDARPDRRKINARALAIDGERLFLCYDAGGLRVIDIAEPQLPREIGRYSHPSMNGKPRAYNGIALDGGRAYLSVDYVGMEVLDISDPSAIVSLGWWNPWNPQLRPLRWFNSPGHTNEIAFDPVGRRVLMAAGRSDAVLLDVSDPHHPRQIGQIGSADDELATWGLDLHGQQVHLAYIRTLGIPFRARWSGIRGFKLADAH